LYSGPFALSTRRPKALGAETFRNGPADSMPGRLQRLDVRADVYTQLTRNDRSMMTLALLKGVLVAVIGLGLLAGLIIWAFWIG
jgi:hypothetical protein